MRARESGARTVAPRMCQSLGRHLHQRGRVSAALCSATPCTSRPWSARSWAKRNSARNWALEARMWPIPRYPARLLGKNSIWEAPSRYPRDRLGTSKTGSARAAPNPEPPVQTEVPVGHISGRPTSTSPCSTLSWEPSRRRGQYGCRRSISLRGAAETPRAPPRGSRRVAPMIARAASTHIGNHSGSEPRMGRHHGAWSLMTMVRGLRLPRGPRRCPGDGGCRARAGRSLSAAGRGGAEAGPLLAKAAP